MKWELSVSVCIRFNLSFSTVWENTTVSFIYNYLLLLFCIRDVSNIWVWYGKRRSFCIKYSSVQVPVAVISFDFFLHRIKLNEVWSNLKLLLIESIYKKSIIHQNTIITIQLSRSCVLHLQFLQRRFHPLLRRLQ